MEIPVGTAFSESVTVDGANTALAVGSGLVDVFATPMMIALMEKAASGCIVPYLEPGQASVGTHVDVGHDAATPVGIRVTATATVTAVLGRAVEFAVEAYDERGCIGRGTHNRAIINLEKFMQKVNAK